MWSHFYYLGTLAEMTLYLFPQAEHERPVEAVAFVRQFAIFFFLRKILYIYTLYPWIAVSYSEEKKYCSS